MIPVGQVVVRRKTVMPLMAFGQRASNWSPLVLEVQADASRLVRIVCVTGQHREMLDEVNTWFGISPDHDLHLMQPAQRLSDFASRALQALAAVIADVKPDAILVQGDTTTPWLLLSQPSTNAYQSAMLNAIAHTRPAESFPEEMNPRVAGVMASYHFARTERAARALISEQVNPDDVFSWAIPSHLECEFHLAALPFSHHQPRTFC